MLNARFMSINEPQFISVFNAATHLGVPRRWLAREARAGRVPCLYAGRRILVNVESVRRALEGRAARGTEEGSSDEA